ncbi:MAG: SDR family oxidoreductase [Phycisphaerales bacterium]
MTDRPLALITGGARRVGRAIALELARAGCDLIVTYRTSASEAHTLVEQAAAAGARATTEHLDLEDVDAVDAWATALATRLPRLDVLVHNASVYEPCPLDEVTAGRAERDLRVHAISPLLLSARLAPLLRDSPRPGGGCVVCLCDIHAGGLPRRGFAPYAISKAALAELVRSLAIDLAPDARAVGVAPGVVQWPDEGYESDDASREAYLARVPLRRSGTPEEAARLVRFLALESTYITGQIVPIDGGRSLR